MDVSIEMMPVLGFVSSDLNLRQIKFNVLISKHHCFIVLSRKNIICRTHISIYSGLSVPSVINTPVLGLRCKVLVLARLQEYKNNF